MHFVLLRMDIQLGGDMAHFFTSMSATWFNISNLKVSICLLHFIYRME